MNQGWERFVPVPPKSVDLDHLPEGVAVQSKSFDRKEVRFSNAQGEVSKPGGQYWLLNAIGSKEIPDGGYLYNPQTQQIEVQWIQGIGSEKAAAPQAKLMSTVISGILNQRLPWGLFLIGVFLVVAVELLVIRSLSFSLVFYFSLFKTSSLFIEA